jgi:RNA polymerase sporulation-specific sigma factor
MTISPGWESGECLRDLSDEEVLARAREGSRPAMEHLLRRYRPLVESRARGYFVSGADHEDVVQEGMIGLFKAIRDFRCDRLVRFRAFADVCVTRQILTAVKAAARRKHRPLNRYVPLERVSREEEELPLEAPADLAGDPEAVLFGRSLADYLDGLGVSGLSRLEIEVVRRRVEGKSYRQVAAELCCPAKRVDNALQRAKRKIWSHIAGSDAA